MSSTHSSDSNSSKGSINSTGEKVNEVDSLGNDQELQQDSEPCGEQGIRSLKKDPLKRRKRTKNLASREHALKLLVTGNS